MATEKFTYRQFQAQYGTDDDCLRAILQRKYGDSITCPSCGVIGAKFHRLPDAVPSPARTAATISTPVWASRSSIPARR